MRHLFVLAVLLFALPAHADTIMLNDSLFHLIDAPTYSADNVYVRNAGCPPGWPAADPRAPCPSPGAPTEVEITSGGSAEYLRAWDSSTITMSGGTVDYLLAYGSSTVTVSGGELSYHLLGTDSATVTMSGGETHHLYADGFSTVKLDGGTVGGNLYALGSSTTIIAGTDFMVNGSSVSQGDITATEGTLTGTLTTGDPLDTFFFRGSDGGDAIITIVPEPATALFVATGLAGLAVAGRWRWLH